MSLEQQLKDGAQSWLAEEILDPARAARLKALVKARSRRWRMLRAGVSAAVAAGLIFAMLGFGPVMVSMASGAPLVGPYITRWAPYDQGAYWAGQKGYVVPVGKAATDKGYTFRVESIVADSARTVIYFTVEGPDLKDSMNFPRIDTTFNLSHFIGGWGGRHEIVDGKMVGSMDMGPLPLPITQVHLRMTEIGGVKGDWTVSFMASRATLDKMARRIPVAASWKGDGYDLHVRQLLQAPTATIVEMDGTAAAGFEVRRAELVSGDTERQVQPGMFTVAKPIEGVQPVQYRFQFDRMDEEPKSLRFRLTEVIHWQDGGPVIDLTRPGERTEYGQVWYRFQSVEVKGGRTEVVLQIAPEYPWPPQMNFRDWVLIDSAGKQYTADGSSAKPANGESSSEMRVSFPGAVQGPLRLEARQHAEPVPGPFEVTIPLK